MTASVRIPAIELPDGVTLGVSAAGRLHTETVDDDDALPAPGPLGRLLPGGGLRRGWTVSATGTALVLALVAEATQAGAWCAAVGLPELGVLAAAELGVAVERLAVVPEPGADAPAVIAALMDGCDIVLVGPVCRITPSYARRLSARARSRRSVLLSTTDWPAAQVTLTCDSGQWRGLGDGHGRLTEREVTVRANGRSAAARPKQTRMLLPAKSGGVAPAIGDDTDRKGWQEPSRHEVPRPAPLSRNLHPTAVRVG
ncbi:hypothetical protein [Fodinicola acaciae]|uniref:hypothetical protein n=1 Tax=Fodinicola acaciae TaxID=2681555 RepID=UPI0013D8B1CD|nr:hypothetical protein [Fodinicola acaciae]